MNRLFRLLSSVGSIAVACGMLAYGTYLIQKNTPKKQEIPVRFQPPMNPDVASSQEGATRSSHTFGGKRYVGGVGIIEPAGEAITIGSQLPGIVSHVLVVPGDTIQEGAPILQLDDRTAKANLDVAQANLRAQEAKLQELLGQIAPQKARVDASLAIRQQMEAALKNMNQELKRAELLASKNAISEEELGQRRLNVETALARVAEADAKHREAVASLALLEGNNAPTIQVQRVAVDQAKAAVAKEEVNLQLHTLRAPKTSTVLQVKVRVGEFLPASVLSNPLITLGVTNPFHVRVDIDEADIPRVQTSAKAYASVRGRPEVRVPLKYVRSEPYVIPKKSLNGSVSERVDTRVLQLIYSVPPEQMQAVPGQQVDVYIEEGGVSQL